MLILKMQNERILFAQNEGKAVFFKWAATLAFITILYNMVEGLISVFLGVEGGTVTLFGFGADSFVEVISGIGIWHMVRRMRQNGNESPDRFEKTALKITGAAFYILTAVLAITSSVDLYMGYKPKTTFWGIIIAAVSISSMWALIHYKVSIGRRFNSQALLSDAACTKTCLYLSVILLIASAAYEMTGLGLLDSLGALGIAAFSFKEGREAFEKARGESCCCGSVCKG